jgi:hypothetical protein
MINTKTSKMSNYKRFNRHECFNEKMFNEFSTVKKDICDWAVCADIEIPTLENQLFGIWDGYLYDGLDKACEFFGVPMFLIYRLKNVVTAIEKHNSVFGETVTTK